MHRKRALLEAGQEAQAEDGSGTEKREVMDARGKADFKGGLHNVEAREEERPR